MTLSLKVVIAAAGRGTRAGLPYPKTLFEVKGQPILIRSLACLSPWDPEPTVIVSPSGRAAVSRCLADHQAVAELIDQPMPHGMGDAVLQVRGSAAAMRAEHLLLAWGDIPFLHRDSIAAMFDVHAAHDNDFTFITAVVPRAYTVVIRDARGRVGSVIETREQGEQEPGPGERDIGVFIFRRAPVLALLAEDTPGKLGKATGEHGFLYIVAHLAQRGFRIEALPIATPKELVSLNYLSDLMGAN